jgi:hypothetical protein
VTERGIGMKRSHVLHTPSRCFAEMPIVESSWSEVTWELDQRWQLRQQQ